MKHLILIVLLFSLLVIVPPAHSQAPCTPPVGYPSSVHWNGTHYAYADGLSLYYHSCVDGWTVQIIWDSAITNLTFDAFPLVDNLYWTTANGGEYQVNISTGVISMLHDPYAPTGEPGGIHSGENQGVGLNPSPENQAVVETTTPPAKGALRMRGLTLWQWVGVRLGF